MSTTIQRVLAKRVDEELFHRKKIKAENSLVEFIKQGWHVLEPGNAYVDGWHTHEICHHLEAVSCGHIKDLLVNIPVRHQKSTSASIFWAAWEWIKQPDKRWLCASYSAALSIQFSVACRRLIQSEWYQARWGKNFTLLGDQNAKERFDNDHRGYRIATSVGGTVLGLGCNRAVVDDPQSGDDANSDVVRETTLRWWDQDMSTRLNNPIKDARVIVMQRLHQCLLPGSLVASNDKHRPIEQINPDDVVITSNGPEKVVATAKKDYSGLVIGIHTWGSPKTLWITENHKVLTKQGWKEAGALTKEDRLLFPVPKESKESLNIAKDLWLPLTIKAAPKKISNVTGARGKVDKKQLVELLDSGISRQKIAEIFGYKNRNTVDNYVSAFKLKRPLFKNIPKTILDVPLFWRFVGYWLAEGSLSFGRNKKYQNVVLVFHKDEKEYMEDIRKLLIPYGIKLRKYAVKNSNAVQISFSSVQVATFLTNFGLGAHNKFLPEWAVTIQENLLKELFLGYWRGDGCQTTKKTYVRIGSVSLPLVYGFSRAMLRIGATSQIYESIQGKRISVIKSGPAKGRTIKTPGGSAYELRVSTEKLQWMPEVEYAPISKTNGNRLDEANKYLVVRVRSLERKHYSGLVYDLETPSHDFLCGTITAHNCDLTGHVLEQGGWVHLCFPAEYEPARKCITDFGGDRRTEEGELLWPERFGPKEIAKLKLTLGPVGYAGICQQRPAPAGGSKFKRENFRYFDSDVPGFYRLYKGDEVDGYKAVVQKECWRFATMDPAGVEKTKSNKPCYTVITVWEVTPDADMLLLYVYRANVETTDAAIKAIEVARRYKLDLIGVEKNGLGIGIVQTIMRSGVTVLAIDAHQNKEVRAQSAEIRIQAGKVYFLQEAPWLFDAEDELIMFPNGEYNDFVDCCAHACKLVQDRHGPPTLTDEPAPGQGGVALANLPSPTAGRYRRQF